MKYLRDLPDDYDIISNTANPLLYDISELAARLGSPVTHDRRGNIIFWDDFEKERKYYYSEAGNIYGGATRLNHKSFSGEYALNMKVGTGSVFFCRFFGLIPPVNAKSLSIQSKFLNENAFTSFDLGLLYSDGSLYFQGFMRYLHNDKKIQYYDINGTWQTVKSNFQLDLHGKLWHHFKVAYSTERMRYMYIMINGEIIDISDKMMFIVAVGTNRKLTAKMEYNAPSAGSGGCWIDDLIVAEGE